MPSRLRGVHRRTSVEHGVRGAVGAVSNARIARGSWADVYSLCFFFVSMRSCLSSLCKNGYDSRFEVLFCAVDTAFASLGIVDKLRFSSPAGSSA